MYFNARTSETPRVLRDVAVVDGSRWIHAILAASLLAGSFGCAKSDATSSHTTAAGSPGVKASISQRSNSDHMEDEPTRELKRVVAARQEPVVRRDPRSKDEAVSAGSILETPKRMDDAELCRVACRRLEAAIALYCLKTQPKASELAERILKEMSTDKRLPSWIVAAKKQMVAGEARQAFYVFVRASQNSSHKAQQLTGMCVMHGFGTQSNVKLAFVTLKHAAEQGNGRAAGQVGQMHELGLGCTKSIGLAEEMYRMGMAADDLDSQAALGGLLLRVGDHDEGFVCLHAAAERGSLAGACGAAKCFALGWGTPQDVKHAEQWFMIAAKADVGEAQWGLAILLASQTQDEAALERSRYWLKRAAESGVPSAISMVRQGADQDLSAALASLRALAEMQAGSSETSYPFDRDPIAPTLFGGPSSSWEERQWFKADW